eukprot:scaffold1276_cov152-Skeletonema_menzelii.AAC.5
MSSADGHSSQSFEVRVNEPMEPNRLEGNGVGIMNRLKLSEVPERRQEYMTKKDWKNIMIHAARFLLTSPKKRFYDFNGKN